MAATQESAELFDWLTDDRMEQLAIKLNALPSGAEFQRRAEEAMVKTLDADDRLYKDIIDEHGDLVGFVDEAESRLPWWLKEFEWTFTSESLDPLTIDATSIEEFEEYPRDSTTVDDISLSEGESFINALDAFVTIEEVLSTARNINVNEIQSSSEIDPSQYDLPDKIFVVQEKGRLATSDAFESWFKRVLNLCPPAAPEMTALLRVNANIEYRHATEALTPEQYQRLVDLNIFKSTDEEAQAFNQQLHSSLRSLLQLEPPFDLEMALDNDKDALTDLQYAYYKAWADGTSRLANEQRWLRIARNNESIEDAEKYRFAEFAFRMPLRIDRSNVIFEDQDRFGGSKSIRRDIAATLSEYGHPTNDD